MNVKQYNTVSNISATDWAESKDKCFGSLAQYLYYVAVQNVKQGRMLNGRNQGEGAGPLNGEGWG